MYYRSLVGISFYTLGTIFYTLLSVLKIKLNLSSSETDSLMET